MRFRKCMGTLGGHGGRLYEVWEAYGDPMGIIGGRLYDVWEVYGDPMGVIYMRFGKRMGTLWGS